MSDISCFEVEVAAQGDRPVVIKRATEDSGALRLDREAGRLNAARHPGVVELLDHDAASLTLAWAGGQTLETVRPALAGAVGLLTVVAETVADLHDMGVVHGRLAADHVVIGAEGRPRLCGMRGVDPEADQPDQADDVAALGRLIDLLVGSGAEIEPIPDRRWRRRRWTGYQRRALQTLADQATDPNPDHRPRARELAAALAQAVPEARLSLGPVEPTPSAEVAADPDPAVAVVSGAVEPGEDQPWAEVDTFLGMRLTNEDDFDGDDGRPDGRPDGAGRASGPRPLSALVPPPRPPFLSGRMVAIAAGLLLAVLAVSVVRSGSSSEDPAAQINAAVASAPTPSTAPVSTRPVGVVRRSPPPVDPRCAPVAAPSADTDGDGCPDTVGVTGSTIQVGAMRYRLGSDGDDVTVGDWDCDGQATPALVRPSTGEVFVFSRWATADEPLSLAPTALVPGVAEPVPTSECGPLRVRSTSGAVTTVTVAWR